jgi:hypothetical protein
MKHPKSEVRASWEMAAVTIDDPEPSWSVGLAPAHAQTPISDDPDAVDADGPDAALGRAHAARPQVLGNRLAIPTASTALRPAPSPSTTTNRSDPCHRECGARYWRSAIRSGRI